MSVTAALDPWAVAVRYPGDGGGWYESFYLKGNHPTRRLGVWLKFNLLEPVGGALAGELWAVWFDGEAGRQVVGKTEVPGVAASKGALSVELGTAALAFSESGLAEHASAGALSWEAALAASAPPVVFLPRRLYGAPFPRKKILTPVPVGSLSGWIDVEGERHSLDGWSGFHGHNWGREHAHSYAYGNALFPDGGFVDGFSARVRIGPALSPALSRLVVRLPSGEELRLRRGHCSWSDHGWALTASGRGGQAELTMAAPAADFVRLEYRQPDGRTGACLNTKFARAVLRVLRGGREVYSAVSEKAELETFASSG